MVICPRCEQPVDENTRTTCPLCFTPLPVPGAAQPAPPPVPQAPTVMPPPGYMPQPGGVAPLAPPDAPTVAPLNASPTVMPTPRAMPAAPMSVPTAAPRMEANQRMTLSGEIIEAPKPMSNAPVAGNSQYQARSSAGAPRPAEKEERSSPNIGAIVLVLALLCGGGGGWYFWMHRTNPKDQAQKYFDAVKAQDPKAMYPTVEVDTSQIKSEEDYVTKSNESANQIPGLKDMVTNMLSGIQFKAGTPKYTNSNEASVPVAMSGTITLPAPGQRPQEVSKTIDLPMKNFNGIWKVPKESPFSGNTSGLMRAFGQGGSGGK